MVKVITQIDIKIGFEVARGMVGSCDKPLDRSPSMLMENFVPWSYR
jgi:hypothetical protein